MKLAILFDSEHEASRAAVEMAARGVEEGAKDKGVVARCIPVVDLIDLHHGVVFQTPSPAWQGLQDADAIFVVTHTSNASLHKLLLQQAALVSKPGRKAAGLLVSTSNDASAVAQCFRVWASHSHVRWMGDFSLALGEDDDLFVWRGLAVAVGRQICS
jgi:hypothetical protein